MPRRVHYLTTGFPGPKAGAVHIARMLDAFVRIGCETNLVRPATVTQRSHPLGDFVNEEIRATTLPSWPFNERTPRAHAASLFAAYAGWLVSGRVSRRFDWLHARDFRLAALAGRLAGPRPVLALEVHHSAAEAAGVPGVDLFVAISNGVARGLELAGVPRRRIVVAHDAVDIRPYGDSARRARELREQLEVGDRYVLGYTGHLYADRGATRMLDALAALEDDVVLVIVGGSEPDLARLAREVADRKLGPRVRLVGQVPPGAVPAYQLASDALVLPYGTDYAMREVSSPLKLHEYMAAGRPIVIGDLPYAREVVDESTAMLVDPDDPRAYARAVGRLRSDPGHATAIAARASAIAAANSWEERARRILGSAPAA